MTFEELKSEISNYKGTSFITASNELQTKIFNLDKSDIIELVSQIGAIPEDIGHDSTEEKLYTKVSDILLAKSFMELGLTASVLQQRADCADVIAQSQFHPYSLVGDAKAFRLSRTARNAKDYKVSSMAHWREDRDYSVLVCPYFQYPNSTSQIYKDALNNNVCLFSWEYLYILLKENVSESADISLKDIWDQSEIIGKTTVVDNSKSCFLPTQDKNIANLIHISYEDFNNYFNAIKSIIGERGLSEIEYYEREIERVRQLDREQAINELIKSMKLESKIDTIRRFLDNIGAISNNGTLF